MRGYKQHTGTSEVPKASGVEGFLLAIRKILELPRLQGLTVDSRGKINYTYVLREEEEEKPFAISFDEVLPHAIIRNGQVQEIPFAHENCAVAAAQMFRLLAVDHLTPISFVAGANSRLWGWYKETTGLERVGDDFFGLPVLYDRHIDDASLVLCGAYSKDSSMADTVKSYKITIPKELK